MAITRKRIISFFMVLGMTSASLVVNSAQKEIDPPLRMTTDRQTLMDMLSDEQILRKVAPLSNESAQKIKEGQLQTQKIKEMPPHDPEPLNRVIQFDERISPADKKEETLYLSSDFSSTFVLLDKEGNKWPLKNITLSLGETVSYSVIDTGTIVFQPKKQFGKGNLVIMPEGANSSISITVLINSDKYDDKLKAVINDYGPYSEPKFHNGGLNLSGLASFAEKDMLLLLQGYKPNEEYKERKTSDNHVKVWSKGQTMFIRTKGDLLSPTILPVENSSVKDVSGIKILAVPYTPSFVILRQGLYVTVNVFR